MPDSNAPWFQPRWWWYWYLLGCLYAGIVAGEHWPTSPPLPLQIEDGTGPLEWPLMALAAPRA